MSELKSSISKLEHARAYYLTVVEKKREYYLANRDKKLAQVECKICNCHISQQHLSRHERTIKHIRNSVE
jgi:hypothetical protein